MCGIAGFISPDKFTGDELRRIASSMTDEIKHRGPDAEGMWVGDETGTVLGHRRLSIVDLSPAGSQPMVSSNGEWVIVYNGEVYNSTELKAELEPHGISWNGTSDTEVIIEAIAAWGIETTVKKLIGMFAFAVWNRRSRVLTLARDRLGIKPAYWSQNSGSLLFGSELKALRQHPDCPKNLNRTSIAGYLRNCYVNNPATIYENVNHLPPGWVLRFEFETQKTTLHQYWSLKEIAKNGINNKISCTESEAIEQLDELLGDAVQRRMISDVPLGAFLSGGIDSSAVVAQMQKFSATPVKTFSIGFEEQKYDESEAAASIAKHLGTDHTKLIVTADDALDVIPDLTSLYDEPFSDPSQIPTYLLSKLTREHVTVALSGDGGDELFAGYNRYFEANKYKYIAEQPKFIRHLGATTVDLLTSKHLPRIRNLLPKKISKHMTESKLMRLSVLLRDGGTESLYRRFLSRIESPENSLINCVEPEYEAWSTARELSFHGDAYSYMQFIDTLDYLPDDILTKVDRASMAASLEARVPILDHRIVEFSWTLPECYKVKTGHGKWILRQVLNKYVPEPLFNRPKQGFGVPIGSWLRGPLRDWAHELIKPESLKETNIFNPEIVHQRWRQHISETHNWEYHLWDVLMMQAWALENT